MEIRVTGAPAHQQDQSQAFSRDSAALPQHFGAEYSSDETADGPVDLFGAVASLAKLGLLPDHKIHVLASGSSSLASCLEGAAASTGAA